jgi:hypothetical protein
MGEIMANNQDLIEKIYQSIIDMNLDYDIFCKGKNSLNNLVIFDEPDLYPGEKSRFRIGNGSIMMFDSEKLILAIEIITKTPTPPKEMAGPIPVYMICRKVKLNYQNGKDKEIEISNKFPLILVVPDQSELKTKQIEDLNEKFRGILNLRTEYSALNDFNICTASYFSNILKNYLKPI